MAKRGIIGAWRPSQGLAFLVALALALAWWMAPGVASAWLSWTGIDPVITLDGGHQVSVRVEWPANFTCTIQGPIEVEVMVPDGLGAGVMVESSSQFPCRTLSTQTSISVKGDGGGDNEIDIAVKLKAGPEFPVKVYLFLDGQQVGVVEGSSQGAVSGSVALPDGSQ